MSRNIDREETLRIAAEMARRKKEIEAQEEKAFYERITSGKQWLLFKVVVVFCTAMALITTIETFVDGPTKKITKNDWKYDRNWEWTWHKVLDVKGYMFAPELGNWSNWDENTIKLTYSPIFRTGKKLSYNIKENEYVTRRHEEFRQESFFNWFPFLQIAMLIPLATWIFKRQSPWFNFARVTSLVFVFPGTLLVIFFAMM